MSRGPAGEDGQQHPGRADPQDYGARVTGVVARSAMRDLGEVEVATIEQNDDPEHTGSGYRFRLHCGDD